MLEGRLRVIQDSDEIVAEAGDLVFKPRGHWHTSWNAGDGTLRLLEIIVPAGLEQLTRLPGEPGGEYNPETLPAWPRNTAAMSTSSGPRRSSGGTRSSSDRHPR